MGPIKWAYEFDNKTNKNAKPVRFVEHCSHGRLTKNVNTKKLPNGERTFTTNGYNGLDCGCLKSKKKNFGKCEHPCMIGDSYYI
mmetsp:Transcript_17804/g.2473  ORF Transcript_17804/g.2473 Transcript_17804/m.2473 type:complete len:84 (-) Transcript_17804:216-467(-)